jgi:uncharacterized protein
MKANRVFSFLLVIVTLFLFIGSAFAEDIQIPSPVGDIYVQDFANVLTEQEKTEVRNMGRALERQTNAQVAVLTINSIGDRSIQEFANEAFRKYGIGSATEDNGVLLVLSLNERQVWIEVGYGLEGRIPDGKAGRILDEYTVPFLQNQQTNKAIIETYKVLANEVLTEYGQEGLQGTVDNSQSVPVDEGLGIPSWLLILIVVVVVFLDIKFFGGTLTHLFLVFLSRGGGRGGGGGSQGGGGGSSGGGGAGRGW